jgi:hypothetical protein
MRERSALNMVLVVLAAAPLVLAVVDFVLAQGNHALRTEVARRQHAIDEAGPLARLNPTLIREIAMAAVKSKDDKLRELLAKNGITIKVNPTPSAPGGKGE